MTLRAALRAAALPLIAVALVAVLLGVQLANGGGDFTPTAAANPCIQRNVTSLSTGIEGLGERLVLIGLDGAACRLGITREALTLQIAEGKQPPSDAEVNAVRAGLLEAVKRMKADGTLPPASDLTREVIDGAKLNFLIKAAIKALPASLINAALKTDDVLTRTINDLDIRKLLTNLKNTNDLTHQVTSAVTEAVKQSLLARLRDLL
jgi:hypothetical protein